MFELLSVNLYDFLKQNHFAGLSAGLIRRFASQLLCTLRFLKEQVRSLLPHVWLAERSLRCFPRCPHDTC